MAQADREDAASSGLVASDGMRYIVVCKELTTGQTTYLGPFGLRTEAEHAASRAEHEARVDPDGEQLQCVVAPLQPPSAAE